MRYLGFFIAIFFMIQGCVPVKKFEEREALAAKYLAQEKDCNEELTKSNIDLEAANEEIARLEKELSEEKADVAELKMVKETLEKQLTDMLTENSDLTIAQRDLLESSTAKQNQLMEQLTEKEQRLAQLEKQLGVKEAELETLAASLATREENMNALQRDLNSNIERINELESVLAKKDSAMLALKNKISGALNGFSSDELTVEEREGKLYISLSEKLMFKSGSFDVEANGESALVKVAEVLEKQSGVDIVVEGHADSDKFSGTTQLKDNWDLSVKRATSVVRILVEKNGLSPENVTAAGRSYYKPLADNETEEGKSKNRRTEIILSPKLEAILDLLKSE